MWSNYLLTSIRVLKRNIFFVSVNLFSIAIAFSLCTLGYFNYQFNADFNKHFDNAENIIKVNCEKSSASGGQLMGISPLPLATAIGQDLPGINTARYINKQKYIRIGDDLFRESAAFVDMQFLQIFNFKLINGQLAQFNLDSEIFISKAMKVRLFGNEKALGESIEIVLDNNQKRTFTIAGVLQDLQENTSFLFDFLIPMENYFDIEQIDENDWSAWVDATFIEKKDDADYTDRSIEQLLNNYLTHQNELNPEREVSEYQVSDILEWGSYESTLYFSGFRGHLHPASVAGTISSAIAVLLLALFNFVNTSLAISRKRLKEIGVRKVIGGSRLDLKMQLFVENLLLIWFALMFSGVITYYLSNAYNAMFPFDIVEFSRINLLSFSVLMIGVWLLASMLSGLYPALYINRFKAVEILKKNVKFSRKNLFTKTLITIQFAVCVYNMFSLIVFGQNAAYQDQLDRGYNIHNSINIPIASTGQFQKLKGALEPDAALGAVTGTANAVGFNVDQIKVEHNAAELDVSSLKVGYSYLESLEVRLSEGLFFSELADNSTGIIINEMLNRQLGGKMLNDWLYYEDNRYRVVGIVEDFNLKPIMLTNKIRPTVIFYASESEYHYANVQVSGMDIYQADARVKEQWEQLFPDELYFSFLQEEVLRPLNQTNNIMLSINSFVAIITILITSLGLYAQVSLNTQSRIKEFGMRKVLGAPIRNILYLINKEILIMFAIACLAGLAGADLVVNMVMDIVYAYHKEVEVTNFFWPVLIVLAIMILSIAQVAWQAAKANPVDQLRSE